MILEYIYTMILEYQIFGWIYEGSYNQCRMGLIHGIARPSTCANIIGILSEIADQKYTRRCNITEYGLH